jgi:hypothetical protein
MRFARVVAAQIALAAMLFAPGISAWAAGAPDTAKATATSSKAATAADKAAAPTATATATGTSTATIADGWITLFDGKDRSAWQEPPARKWKVADGVLTSTPDCGNLWTKEKFGDFTVDLEFKCSKDSNSGVFLRSAKGEENWLDGSIEIQILSSYGPNRKPDKHDSGAVYDCLEPSVAAEKPIGEWNHMVITARGNAITVVLNSKTIIDTNLDKWTEAHKNPDGTPNKFKTAYKDMDKVGYLGLQYHGSDIAYRNIKIKKLDGGK